MAFCYSSCFMRPGAFHTCGTEHGQQTAENQNYFQLPEKQKETASEANSGFQNPN